MAERRNYFRIDDYISLDYKKVEAKTVAHSAAEDLFPTSAALKLHAELKKIDSDNTQLLFQIKEQNRQLGEYLHLLNRKIDMLSQHLMADQQKPDRIPRQVSLSEGGIAFTNGEALKLGSYIALHMTFLPSYLGVILYARIARCEADPVHGWQIAAEFHQVTPPQQQLISQQIMRAQLADKRRQRESS